MQTFSKIIKVIGAMMMLIGIVGAILGSFDYVLVISNVELPQLDWTTGIIVTAIGGVFFGLGHLMTKKFGDVDAPAAKNGVIDGPELDMNNLGFVINSIKKTRRRNLWMGLFLGIFGALMVILPFALDESTGIKTGLGIFGGICLLTGIWSFFQYSKLVNIEGSEIYQLIMHNPGQITGLEIQSFSNGYTKAGQTNNATIRVGKKSKGVLAITETDAELLRQYLLRYNANLEVKHSATTVN